MLAVKGFPPLVLALPTISLSSPTSVQQGTSIVPTIRGFDPLVLLRPILGIFGVIPQFD